MAAAPPPRVPHISVQTRLPRPSLAWRGAAPPPAAISAAAPWLRGRAVLRAPLPSALLPLPAALGAAGPAAAQPRRHQERQHQERREESASERSRRRTPRRRCRDRPARLPHGRGLQGRPGAGEVPAGGGGRRRRGQVGAHHPVHPGEGPRCSRGNAPLAGAWALPGAGGPGLEPARRAAAPGGAVGCCRRGSGKPRAGRRRRDLEGPGAAAVGLVRAPGKVLEGGKRRPPPPARRAPPPGWGSLSGRSGLRGRRGAWDRRLRCRGRGPAPRSAREAAGAVGSRGRGAVTLGVRLRNSCPRPSILCWPGKGPGNSRSSP